MSKLYITVGIPGVGKTTWVKKNASPFDKILESDDIREELYGDAAYQGNPAEIFSLMRNRAIEYLKDGYNVWYCATNMTRKDRRAILADVHSRNLDVEIIACIFVAPIEECKRRNAARKRVVPDEVIDRMARRFQMPLYSEGIDLIRIIHTAVTIDINSEMIKTVGFNQRNHHHQLPLWNHLQVAARHAMKKKFGSDVRLAAMLHDIGKLYTGEPKEDTPEEYHYYSHQNMSSWIALTMGANVRVAQLICYHMIFFDKNANWELKFKEDYGLWRELNQLHECDFEAH